MGSNQLKKLKKENEGLTNMRRRIITNYNYKESENGLLIFFSFNNYPIFLFIY